MANPWLALELMSSLQEAINMLQPRHSTISHWSQVRILVRSARQGWTGGKQKECFGQPGSVCVSIAGCCWHPLLNNCAWWVLRVCSGFGSIQLRPKQSELHIHARAEEICNSSAHQPLRSPRNLPATWT